MILVLVLDDQRFDYDHEQEHENENEKKRAGLYGLSKPVYQLTSTSPRKSQINPPSAR